MWFSKAVPIPHVLVIVMYSNPQFCLMPLSASCGLNFSDAEAFRRPFSSMTTTIANTYLIVYFTCPTFYLISLEGGSNFDAPSFDNVENIPHTISVSLECSGWKSSFLPFFVFVSRSSVGSVRFKFLAWQVLVRNIICLKWFLRVQPLGVAQQNAS